MEGIRLSTRASGGDVAGPSAILPVSKAVSGAVWLGTVTAMIN